MFSQLNELKITKEEIESLTNLGFVDSLAIDFYKVFFFRELKRFFSLAIANLSTFLLILVFVMPIGLLGLRGTMNSIGDETAIAQSFLKILGICIGFLVVWNIYLWQKSKQLKSIAILSEKVEQYNRVIEAIELVDKLESSSVLTTNKINNREELLEALKLTKEGLINALKIENIIRKHRNLIKSRYELLSNLETNLTALMTFEPACQISEYSKLLDDTLQIGLTVHREIKSLQNRH
ncbi:hypothetical protein HC931_18140 [Candidatus Gracilibacteria bacterium]|nr:hypothetical protein [Candidatus Gracilibacteria bacterium]NJM89250.1 hypothetical protein [Hydrococcus sp. RU_2_2]